MPLKARDRGGVEARRVATVDKRANFGEEADGELAGKSSILHKEILYYSEHGSNT